MKNLFISIKQGILKYRKRLVYGALVLFIGQICFFGLNGAHSEVFADNESPNTLNEKLDTKISEWQSEISFISKAIYVLIYPILILAGKLCDNSFVYGADFGFDVVLWKLWNIVKNLATYTLGFLFLYKIFKYLIDGKEKVKDIILKALIAGIGIQSSWFVMSALVDVSTILAYSVGGLPISVLKQGSDDYEFSLSYNPYVLKTVVDIDAQDVDTMHIYLTDVTTGGKQSGKFYISECETFSLKDGAKSEEFLLAPKMIHYRGKQTEKNICHYYGQVYYFSTLYGELYSAFGCGGGDCEAKQIVYDSALLLVKSKLKDKEKTQAAIAGAQVLQIGDAHVEGGVVGGVFPQKKLGNGQGLDLYNKRTGEGKKTSRLQDIMDGNSYVGIFSALYSSLLTSARGSIPSSSGFYPSFLNVVLSLCYLLAIGIPLIAAAMVFIMRVGVLWLAIALSPFIVLATAFPEIGKSVFKGKFLEYLSLTNLIPIVFSPAVICFAVSMSAVLVKIISGLNFGVDSQVMKPILGGLINLDIGGLSVSIAKMVVSVFGIAIAWFLVWAAVESSKLGESKTVQGFKSLVESALGSVPIVPVVGKGEDGNPKIDFVGTNTAFGNGGLISKIASNMKQKYESRDMNVIDDMLDPDKVKGRQDEAYKNAIIGLMNVPGGWTKAGITITSEDGKSSYQYKFDQVSPDKKKGIIEAINSISDKDKRAQFGNSESDITFNNGTKDVKYVFVEKDNSGNDVYKYKLQE